MGNGSEEQGGKRSPDDPSEKFSKDKAKFPPLTFEDHAWLVARLETLRHRGTREYVPWKAELEVVLKSTPILEPILKMLEDIQPSSEQNFEYRITQVIDAALRVVNASSPSALGDGLRHLVAQQVEKVIWESKTVRVIRWGAVVLTGALGAALLGGTIWGAYKVDGLYKLAKDTEIAIEKSFNAVRDEARQAQSSIRNLADDAQQKIDKQIAGEVAARTTKLRELFDELRDSATRESGTKLTELREALDKLKTEYAGKSENVFKDHSQATDQLWKTQQQNWLSVLNDRKEVVSSHINTVQSNVDDHAAAFRTNLDTALKEARQKTPELESRLQALDNQMTKVSAEVKAVDEHIGGLVATHRQLDDLINKLDKQSEPVGFISLVRVLEIKDGLAVAAIVLALACLVYGFSLRRRFISTKSGSAAAS